jgi:hypothetical protein
MNAFCMGPIEAAKVVSVLCHPAWKEGFQLVPENISEFFKACFRRMKLIVPGTGLRL